MKKLSALALAAMIFIACSNNNGESGVQNDGINAVDSNGALADTTYLHDNSSTDTTKGEHRVDISTRDTFDR